MQHLWMALLALGCSEYDLKGTEEEVDPPITDSAPPTEPEPEPGDSAPPPDEECNGEDDDGDGEIDEGFPDVDEDGTADCEDACVPLVPDPSTTAIDEECLGAAETGSGSGDPWDIAIEWEWEGYSAAPTYQHVIVAPLVGTLNDDDGDGDADADDVPDVVVLSFARSYGDGYLVTLDGQTGSEHWAVHGVNPMAGSVLADVDSDGWTDIVVFDQGGRPTAYRGDGSLLWRASVNTTALHPGLVVADVDGDGTVEVMADYYLLDGVTGALEQTLPNPANSSIPYTMPAIGDIDLDGTQEILLGRQVYEPDGSVEWATSVSGSFGHWWALVQADADPEAEVLVIGSASYALHEHDGSLIASTIAGSSSPGPPCVADFDGDGDAEVAWASSGELTMRELDGTPVWSAAVQDNSGLAACSGYDLDGDGALEVLFADEVAFRVLDGLTGASRFYMAGHVSGTIFEFPVIADVDGDDSAEVLLPNDSSWSSGWTGVTVFGQATDGWPRSGPTWNVHDFAVTNIDTDGGVPAAPLPSWQAHNVYRARPAVDELEDLVDLRVDLADLCVESCEPEGLAHVVVQVANTGLLPTEAEVPVSLYRSDDGVLSLLETRMLPPLAPGEVAAGLQFTIPMSDYGSTGVAVRVDAEGAVVECDEDDNLLIYTDSPCP